MNVTTRNVPNLKFVCFGLLHGVFGFALACVAVPGVAHAVTCDLPATVGGGTLGVSSPSAGAGWDVGTGQCNGDFAKTTDPTFPGTLGNDGIELGMRAEQRSVGQINPPAHSIVSGIDNYEVQTGKDPSRSLNTQSGRGWWNFQHSIAFDGAISTELDALTFVIRTDVGPSVPTGQCSDMLFCRQFIDDRNNVPVGGIHVPLTNPTATYADLYQTSQNTYFGYFQNCATTPHTTAQPNPCPPLDQAGAWMLTLAAGKNTYVAHVSICVHTPGEVCNAAPKVYTCQGFGPPLNKPVLAKKRNRVLPLKMTCADNAGNVLTDSDIAPPIVQVTKTGPPGMVTDDGNEFLSAGKGTGTNQFEFNGNFWQFNLSTKNFDGTGTYTITAGPGSGDVLVNPPTGTFMIP